MPEAVDEPITPRAGKVPRTADAPLLHASSTLESRCRTANPIAFDPAFAGTPEDVWRETLAQRPTWSPEPGPLLVVSPHPDDEVLGAGGLIHWWSSGNYPVTLLSVTDGEAAYPDWKDLAVRRREELDRALETLSSKHIHTIRLGLPDGGGAANRTALQEALAALCDLRPTLIAPYERDGHPDHEAAGEACLQIARELELPIARYPIWAWHHRRPDDFKNARIGRFAFDSATQAAKALAINCFTSQLTPGGSRTPIVPAHVLAYFRRDYEAFLL
jgi:LmbE family N-acetylglucosaminyl deacetylase